MPKPRDASMTEAELLWLACWNDDDECESDPLDGFDWPEETTQA